MKPLRAFLIALLVAAVAPMSGCLDSLATANAAPVKEFTLEAVEADVELYPGKTVRAWTYNGELPGPVIRVTEGDLVRVHFWNNHTLPHTIHFHGDHPYEMDGADHQAVPAGGYFLYEFVAGPVGSFVYHCHVDTPVHVPMGLYGQFIVEPKSPTTTPPDVEAELLFSDWNPRHNATAETYLINGKAFPATEAIRAEVGDRVRLHVSSLTHAPIGVHLHGHLPQEVWPGSQPIDVVPLAHAETRVLEFTAKEPGVWMLHDHYEQHLVNDGKYPGGSMTAIEVGEEWWGKFMDEMAHAAPGSTLPNGGGHADAKAPPAHGGHGSAATPAEEVTVRMVGFRYEAPEVTVTAGTTVTWVNEDPAAHTVTSEAAGGPDSGDIAPGASFSHTFTEPGTYEYRCVPHSAKGASGAWEGMVGRVVVTG